MAAKKPPAKPKKPEKPQSERFKEFARTHGADETGETLERAFKDLGAAKKQNS